MNTSLQNIESTPHNVVWISYENKSIPVPVTSLDNPAFLTREQNFLHSYKILRFSPKDSSHAELMLRPIFKAHLPREVLGTPVQKNG